MIGLYFLFQLKKVGIKIISQNIQLKILGIFTISFFISIPFATKSYATMPVIDVSVVTAINAQTSAQTTATAKKIAEFAKQTIELGQIVSLTQSQLNALTGKYNLFVNFDDYINELTDIYDNNLNVLTSKTIDGKILDNKSIKDITLLLDNVYPSIKNPRANVYEPFIMQYKANSYKSALELSEYFINNSSEILNNLKKTIALIKDTETLKEAMDVNNRLLSEILLTLQQQTQLLAQLVRTESASKYEGDITDAKQKKETRTQEVKESLNENADVFKVNENDLPFSRKKKSVVDGVFGGNR